jgi:hypothetical protein
VVVINPEAQFIFLDSISLRLALIGTWLELHMGVKRKHVFYVHCLPL